MMSPMPLRQLSNGLIVGNLTSGHSFEFEDGCILDACDADRVTAGTLFMNEKLEPVRLYRPTGNLDFSAIKLEPNLTPEIINMLVDARLVWLDNKVHVVIVPLMLLEGIKKLPTDTRHRYDEFCFAIRKNGRDSDHRRAKIYIDRFCS